MSWVASVDFVPDPATIDRRTRMNQDRPEGGSSPRSRPHCEAVALLLRCCSHGGGRGEHGTNLALKPEGCGLSSH